MPGRPGTAMWPCHAGQLFTCRPAPWESCAGGWGREGRIVSQLGRLGTRRGWQAAWRRRAAPPRPQRTWRSAAAWRAPDRSRRGRSRRRHPAGRQQGTRSGGCGVNVSGSIPAHPGVASTAAPQAAVPPAVLPAAALTQALHMRPSSRSTLHRAQMRSLSCGAGAERGGERTVVQSLGRRCALACVSSAGSAVTAAAATGIAQAHAVHAPRRCRWQQSRSLRCRGRGRGAGCVVGTGGRGTAAGPAAASTAPATTPACASAGGARVSVNPPAPGPHHPRQS